jgi:gluconokinase
MVLVLDLGSSSTRASIYDEQANVVADLSARAPVMFVVSEDGRSEDDAEAAFRRVVAVLDELHGRANARGAAMGPRPSTLAISAYASSLVCLDGRGAPLTPVFTYADTRSAEDARRLRTQHDELATLRRTGCRIRANYLPSKLAWIKRTRPEVFAQTRWFASLSDYICLRLFGSMSAGTSVASWTGLLDRATSEWDGVWLVALGIAREQLPRLAPRSRLPAGSGVGAFASEWAERWPLFAGAACQPPIGDGAAANVGSGCTDDGRIAITIGSTAALRVVTRTGMSQLTPQDPALWAYRVDHDHDLIGGATTEGGNVIAWARTALQLPEDMEPILGSIPPDRHRLTVLPTFAGERSPGYAEDIRATLHGLSLDTSPVELVRALMEGISLRLAVIYDALRASGLACDGATLVGSGGALLGSPSWGQIISDVCGVPLQLADVPEATSRGTAILARPDWPAHDWLPEADRRFEPDAGRHSIYRAAMARQQELYAKLVRSGG